MVTAISRVASTIRSPRRSRRLRVMLTLTAAIIGALITVRALADAAAVRERYGVLRSMPVASHDLEIGHTIEDDDLVWTMLPVALMATSPVSDPLGRTVIEPVVGGEVLLDHRVSGSVDAGPAALVSRTSRAIAIDRSLPSPALEPGDRVDLYASTPRTGVPTVARRAMVLEVDDHAVVVVVTEAEAPAVARAALDGAVVLALHGAG